MSLVETYPHLLDQDALEGPKGKRLLRLFDGYDAEEVAKRISQYAAMTARMEIDEIPAGVVIHGRQEPVPARLRADTTPARQPERIIATARNVRAQTYGGPLVIAALVDHPEFQPTAIQVTQLHDLGVRIIEEPPETNNPRALHHAFSEVKQEDGLTVVMSSGNRFVTNQALRAAARHIGGDAVAAYGPRLMDHNTTDPSGQQVLMGNSVYYEQYADIDRSPSSAQNGYGSVAGIALCSFALDQLPLSEAYGRGGAIRHWAAQLQASGFEVVYDPTLAVHDHSNPGMDTMREEATWLGPTDWPV